MLLLDKLYTLPPECGKITIGGVDINDIRTEHLRKNIGIVLQEPYLFSRTIAENIGITDPNITQEKINEAAKAACLDETVNSFANGYNTFVGERGVTLSGGQKQRVWIAMALAQDTKILFFDEPTTYLDIRYQLQILRLVKRLNSEFNITVIMVLHDINQSLYYSDEIVAMHDGKIRSQGIPKEIITPKLIEDVYGVTLETGEIDGKPFVMPV